MSYFTDEDRVRSYEIVCAFTAGASFMGAVTVLLIILSGA